MAILSLLGFAFDCLKDLASEILSINYLQIGAGSSIVIHAFLLKLIVIRESGWFIRLSSCAGGCQRIAGGQRDCRLQSTSAHDAFEPMVSMKLFGIGWRRLCYFRCLDWARSCSVANIQCQCVVVRFDGKSGYMNCCYKVNLSAMSSAARIQYLY